MNRMVEPPIAWWQRFAHSELVCTPRSVRSLLAPCLHSGQGNTIEFCGRRLENSRRLRSEVLDSQHTVSKDVWLQEPDALRVTPSGSDLR